MKNPNGSTKIPSRVARNNSLGLISIIEQALFVLAAESTRTMRRKWLSLLGDNLNKHFKTQHGCIFSISYSASQMLGPRFYMQKNDLAGWPFILVRGTCNSDRKQLFAGELTFAGKTLHKWLSLNVWNCSESIIKSAMKGGMINSTFGWSGRASLV